MLSKEFNEIIDEYGKRIALNKRLLETGKKIVSMTQKKITKREDCIRMVPDLSFKIDRKNGEFLKAFRNTDYFFYDSEKINLESQLKLNKKREILIMSIFKRYGLLSKKNQELIDCAFQAFPYEKEIIPVQFGFGLAADKITFKLYLWVKDRKERGLQKFKHKYLNENVLRYFNDQKMHFFDDKKIRWLSFDFSKKSNSLKIYIDLKFSEIIEVASGYGYSKRDIENISYFYKSFGSYFKKEILVCFEITQENVILKKIEFHPKNYVFGQKELQEKLTNNFLEIFGGPLWKMEKYKTELTKNTVAYVLGKEFLAIYVWWV